MSTCLSIVLANYKEIQKQMREGGLKWQRYKVLYGQIKQNHKRVLRQLNRDKEEIDEMKKKIIWILRLESLTTTSLGKKSRMRKKYLLIVCRMIKKAWIQTVWIHHLTYRVAALSV